MKFIIRRGIMQLIGIKNHLRNILIIFFSIIFIGDIFAQQNIQAEVNHYLANLPFGSFSINLPKFQDKDYNIKDYGAAGDGYTMNTEAFKKAVEACAEAGGGRVIVPPGIWLTGPIELKSNINFHLERGALILFSPDHKDYPIVKIPHGSFAVASPVYGYDLENIAITGEGLFDGNGTTWRPVKKSKVTSALWKSFVNSGGVLSDDGSTWFPSAVSRDGDKTFVQFKKNKKEITSDDLLSIRDAMRPKLISLMNCKRILIDGVTFENSPSFAFNPNFCEDMVIKDVKINNEYWAQNGDGIDIGSSKNVLVYNCTVSAGDDGICMKSSKGKSSIGPALENIVIENCVVYHAHGGFVIGSNTDGGIHNIFVRNCDFVGTDVGLRFKSGRDRGALVDNIFISNIFMKDILNEAILFNTYYENEKDTGKSFPVTERTPVFKDFHIDSIFCTGAKSAASITGLPEMPIQNIKIADSYISAERGVETDNAKNILFDNVKLVNAKGPLFKINQSSDFVLNKISFQHASENFMNVSGKDTKSISIENTDIKSFQAPIIYTGDVDKNSVVIK